MTDIIEKWLLNSIGVNISLSPSVLGEACFDGTLYTKILLKYSICSPAYAKAISRTKHFEVAYSNLKKLCVWFKLLGIPYSDDFLKDIANKKGSAALRLLYELFICLENRENMRFVDAKKKERLLTESTDKFLVKKVVEAKPEIDLCVENKYLYDAFNKGQGLISEFVEKERNFMELCLLESRKRRAAITEKLKKSFVPSLMPVQYIEIPKMDNEYFEKILVQFEEKLYKPGKKEDIKQIVDCNPKEFISLLKLSRRKSEADRCLKERMVQDTLRDSWGKLLALREKMFQNDLTKKLLKQSEYEKQMLLRLRRLRFSYKNFLENRKILLDVEEKQKNSIEFKETFRAVREKDLDTTESLRIKELQKRLLQEKKKLRDEKYFKVCRCILADLIDFALITLEYRKEFNKEPSKQKMNSWKLMFIKEMPLFECLSREETNTNHGIFIDDKCSEMLAEYEYHLYNCLLGPWSLNEHPHLLELFPEKLDGIGYIVHQLLDLKYNYAMSFGTPTDFPQYGIQVLLKPVNNLFVVERLKVLLSKAKIVIIDVNTVTNNAIQAYNTYLEAHDITKVMLNLSNEHQRRSVSLRKTMTSSREENKAQFKRKTAILKQSAKPRILDACVQVPSLEEVTNEIPRVVLIGGLAECYLSEGLPLPDVLTCLLILEYLKSLNDINGWLLLNFPQDLKQVAILEYLFSGREIPYIQGISENIWYKIRGELQIIDEQMEYLFMNNISVEDNQSQRNILKSKSKNNVISLKAKTKSIQVDGTRRSVVENLEDEEEDETNILDQELQMKSNHLTMSDIVFFKRSNILPKPYPDRLMPPFKSIFTKVIRLKTCSTDFMDVGNTDLDTERIELIEHLYEGDSLQDVSEQMFLSESVDKFYRGLHILQSFHYEEFSHDSVLNLAHAILNEGVHEGDPSWTDAVDSFGFETLVQVKPKRTFQYSHCVTENDANQGILLHGPVYQRPSLENLTKVLYGLEGSRAESSKYKTTENEIYNTESIFLSEADSDHTLYKGRYESLSSVWETIEYFYVYNMTEIFNFLRVIDTQLMPYRNFILSKLKRCLELVDDRSRVVTNFQVMFNSITLDLRQVRSMKNELHHRTYELHSLLGKLTDVKKIFSHEVLKDLIKHKWLPKQSCNYLRGFSCLMQVEADRFIDTMQLLLDYFYACMSKQPSTKRINKIFLPRFEWESTLNEGSKEMPDFSPRTHKSFKSDAKSTASKKNQNFKRDFPNKMRVFSMNFDEPSVLYCAEILEGNLLVAFELLNHETEKLKIQINKTKDFCNTLVEETYDRRSLIKDSKVVYFQPSETYARTGNFHSNWFSLLDDESNRALFRISLLHSRGTKTIEELINVTLSTFETFEQEVLNQHHKERLNIDKLCDLLRVAIEEEAKIQPSIVLNHNDFYLDPTNLMYPCPPPPEPSALEEVGFGQQFTICQLTNFLHKMSYTAPLGILKQTFVYILHDMASFGCELGYPYLTPIWSSFSLETISDLVSRWFGKKLIICWKEFIIFALDFLYPTLKEILSMKEQFEAQDPEHTELVSREQYMNSFLWFEKHEVLGLEQSLRRSKAKDLLFKLFQVNEKQINYSCFLLYICRDIDPFEGFLKALTAINGCQVVSSNEYVLFNENIQLEHDEEKYYVAKMILDEIIDAVFLIQHIVVQDKIDDKESLFYESLQKFENIKSITKSQYFEGNIQESRGEQLLSNTTREEAICESSMKTYWKHKFKEFTLTSSTLLDYEVHFDTILSLFVFYLQYYSISPNHTYQNLALEKNLTKIFSEKGDGYIIKLSALVDDNYIKQLLSSYRLFQPINITHDLNLFNKSESAIADAYVLQ